MRSTLGTLRCVIAGRRPAGREVGSARAEAWALRLLALLAAAGRVAARGGGGAVLPHPPLCPALRPWGPRGGGVGLLSTAAGYWLLWGRGR
ncbi:MAG: hypothetical protein F4Y29_04455 [Chloroflexi bacterium]|nr:hypothetical protein [Chloroflexota bacterium]